MDSDSEAGLLHTLSLSLLSYISAFTAVSVLYGVFAVLFTISTIIFLRKGLKTLASFGMFAVTVITFILCTIYWVSDLLIIVCFLDGPFAEDAQRGLLEGIKLALKRAIVPGWLALWSSLLLPIISDAVVIWRACVLYYGQRWVLILPMALLLGTSATTVACGLLIMITSQDTSLVDIDRRLFGTSIILSLVTNIITTMMITYKVWCHRKVVDILGHARSQKVLDLLLESGLVYCVLQTVTLTLDGLLTNDPLGTPHVYATQIFLSCYTVLAAMYPTIIIVLVNTHRSVAETLNITDITIEDGMAKSSDPDVVQPAALGRLYFAANSSQAESGSFYTMHRVQGSMEKPPPPTPPPSLGQLPLAFGSTIGLDVEDWFSGAQGARTRKGSEKPRGIRISNISTVTRR